MSVNKVILLGNLGKDPEIRSLEGGAKVAKFRCGHLMWAGRWNTRMSWQITGGKDRRA